MKILIALMLTVMSFTAKADMTEFCTSFMHYANNAQNARMAGRKEFMTADVYVAYMQKQVSENVAKQVTDKKLATQYVEYSKELFNTVAANVYIFPKESPADMVTNRMFGKCMRGGMMKLMMKGNF